ncbi:MAG: HYR domain-containing protein, partial [Saprospiraceae bacterium]
DVIVTQIDDTGLTTGSLFPVGTTILTFEARDESGNVDTCEMKVIVNDFHTPPTMNCPVDQTINNDPAMCGAVVDNISPFDIVDNCPDNIAITYEIVDESGNFVAGGLEDASGTKFPAGINTVTYTVFDQPILLITEVLNDGNKVGLEISNFGPATLDLSCINISREGVLDTVINVPNGTIVPVGEVYTVYIDAVDPVLGVGYTISMLDNVIDGIALNGYSPTTFDWTGDLMGSNVYRSRFPDMDNADDWSASNSCSGLSFGIFNPELPIFEDNGVTVSMQSSAPNSASCSFTITILDTEAPYCASLEMTDYPSTDTPLIFTNGACATSIINVTDVFDVSDVNIIDLEGDYPDMSEVTVTLTSPQGTVVTLFDGLCAGTDDWDIDLDDQALESQASITCNPLGGGNIYQPLQSMEVYYGESAFGDWILDVFATGNGDGELTSWTLQLSQLAPYTQTDTTLVNDTLVCGANFEWTHPFIGDNCEAGSIVVEYINLSVTTASIPFTIEAGTSTSEFFTVGTTQILYTLTDAAGNTSQCGFEVTVQDTEAPNLSLADICNDVIIQLDAGGCVAQIPALSGNIPEGATDNCGIDSVAYNIPLGYNFPIGITPVTITVFDAAGNEQSCTFNVEVREYVVEGNQIVCNDQINLSLGPDCIAEITADMLLEGGGYGCYDNYMITINGPSGEIGNSVNGTNFVGLDEVDMLLDVTVCTPGPLPNCCTTQVLVELKQIPEIECAADTIISCNMATNPEFTGYPTVLTCEQDITMTYFDEYEDFGPCGEPRARITRGWTITDESGNIVTCTQIIEIEQFDVEDIEFPADFTIDTGLNCADVAADPTLTHPDTTGYPTINGVNVPISTNGLCMVSWNWDDQILFSCQGSYEILRKWFIRDMCEDVEIGVNPIEHYQIIKIIDNEGPNIHECPDNIIVSTDPWSCTGTYQLADIISTIDDNCGGVDQVQVTVNGGTVIDNLDGTYTITNMQKGEHLVRLRARDYCYNYSTCEFVITVEDGTAPVVVCRQFVVVSLTTGGVAKMFTESVDAGSYDNCTTVKKEIFRMKDNCSQPDDLLPGDFVEFCCADIEDSPIMVALRVWDDANMDGIVGNEGDNSSTCMVEVTVEEKLPPAITCPADITLECNADIENFDIVGEATVTGACLNHTAIHQDFVNNINDCGAAVINRIWSVEGRPEISCTQVIVLETGMPFNGNIQWPADWAGDCLENIPQAEPIFLEGVCDAVAFSSETDTFNFVENVCYKLVKHWTVIDWCQYQPNNPNTGGIWKHTQIIKITDDTAPEIQDCADVTIDLTGENCIQDIVIIKSAIDSVCGINAPMTWSYELDLDADGTWDIEVDNNDNTGDILIGTEASMTIKDATPGNYKIRWKAFDGCGNVGSCQYNIVIRDGKAPTPYCYSSQVTVLMQDVGTIAINAENLNIASFDNCTASEDLVFSFSGETLIPSMNFTCADISNGVSETFELEMWVWDEAGNKEFCVVTVEIQDNLDICQDTNSDVAIISGQITTEEAHPVNQVEVVLSSFAPEYPHQNTSNDDGEFFFLYNPVGYDYKAKSNRNTNYREGVSTLDLVMIQRHILEIERFESGYKVIAGDINDDERLTASDLLALRKLILGVKNDFKNESWRFVDKNYTFADIYDPFPFDERVEIADLMDNVQDVNFVGVKIGDVNGSISNNLEQSNSESTPRTLPEVKLIMNKVTEGDRTFIEFRNETAGKFYGMQFGAITANFDVKALQSGAIEINPEMISVKKGMIKMSYSNHKGIDLLVNEVLFTIELMNNKDDIAIIIDDKNIVDAEIYINELTINKLVLSWKGDEQIATDFRLDQNEPNPFIDETVIGFKLPKSGKVTLKVYSVDGKTHYTATKEYPAGEHSISLSAKDIGVKGMVFYELSGDGFLETKKMIIVE